METRSYERAYEKYSFAFLFFFFLRSVQAAKSSGLGSFGRGLSSVFGGSKKKDKESPAEKGNKDDGR